MGVYYTWINCTKRQLLENVFENGHKLFESCGYEVQETNALLTLLATDWYGDFVAFVPDEGRRCHVASNEGGAFGRLRELTGDYPLDYAEDWFDNITGIFKCAEGMTGWFPIPKGPDGKYIERPFEGPFDRDIVRYRYVINETKREWYDRANGGTEYDPFDPLPILLSLSENHLSVGRKPLGNDGIWMGDTIRPANKPPAGDYRDITGLYEWW